MVDNGEVVKRYFSKGKFVTLILFDNGKYSFKIDDKCTKQSYYCANLYNSLTECECDSYKVVKGV